MGKQSSIEWYASSSHELIVKKNNGEITEREFLTMHHNLFYDAEAMHKEEVQDVYRISPNNELWSNSGIDYYNETFGGNNE